MQDTKAREAQAAQDLAGQGHLLRLWALPGAGRALGLYQARDATQLEAILASLPLAPWMTVDTTPLSPHPSDPARYSAAGAAVIAEPAMTPATGQPGCAGLAGSLECATTAVRIKELDCPNG